MDKSHVEVYVCIFLVGLFQALCRGLEPVDLVRFDPVVAPVLAFVGRVGMGVEHVECKRGVLGGTRRKDFKDVVANTINVGWAGLGERVGQIFDQRHHCSAVKLTLGVVVAKDGGKWYAALDEELCVF